MAINKRKILQSAQKHLQKGALEKALKDYQTLLGADPRDTNIRLKIGDLRLRRGDTRGAVEAYLQVAAQFMKDGFDAKAVAIYKQVNKVDAERREVWEPLAELYQRMGLSAEAMAALQTAADSHNQAGRRHEALDLLRKMASLDPTNTTSRLKVAELLRADQRNAEAVAEYREAAAELERQGEGEGAAAALDQALELEPEDADLHEQAVRVHLQAGNAPRAESIARRLVEIESEAPVGYELLAEVLQALGRSDELTDVYRRLAEAHRKRGDEDAARAILQRFVPVQPLGQDDSQPMGAPSTDAGTPTDEPLQFGGAHDLEIDPGSLAEEGAPVFGDLPPIGEGPAGTDAPTPPPADAEPSAEVSEVVDVDADPEQLLAEASVYLRYGKHDRAIVSLEALIAAEPDHVAALEKLGEAYAVAKRPTDAVQSYTRAAHRARDAGDAERFDVLRGRVEALDASAAEALGAMEPSAPPEPLDDAGFLDEDIEFSVSDGLDDFDDDDDAAEGDDEETSAAALPKEDAPPPTEAGEDDGAGSGTTPEQILEDLETAEFYRQQGMLDEAEALYRSVLEVAPGHPQAMLRLGEIEAAGSRPASAEAPSAADREGSDPIDDLAAELAREDFGVDEEPAEAPGPEAPAASSSDLVQELAEDSFGLGDETPDPFGFAEEPPPDPPSGAATPAPTPEPEAPPAEVTFPSAETGGAAEAEEGEGFDLAAALSEALDGGSEGAEASTEDAGFATLFDDFKRGVQQTLGEGDGESRYDLGIAYREMGLHEDAFEEFLIALQSSERRFHALHMLALCAVDLGRVAEVTPLLRGALDEGAPEPQQPSLRYDLGSLYELQGQTDDALESFRFVAGIAPGFRDVEQRIAALEAAAPGPTRAPEPAGQEPSALATDEPEVPSAESGFESFDDVVSEIELEGAVPEAPQDPEPAAEASAPGKPSVEPAPEPPVEPEAAPSDEPESATKPEAPERPRTRRRKISFF